eukprot:UN08040
MYRQAIDMMYYGSRCILQPIIRELSTNYN